MIKPENINLSDEQLLRYKRHIMLPEIDIDGQLAMTQSQLLIIGVGGLGSPAALYLAAAGIGGLTLADADQVELANLQRQIAYNESMLGKQKVQACKQSLQAINHGINIKTLALRLQGDALQQAVADVDVVLDCSDNLATRFEVNRACFRYNKPLVSAAAIRWEGQVSVFIPGQQDSPCYQCCHSPNTQLNQNCTSNGVLGPLTGVIGSMQAIEAIKLITGAGDIVPGRTLLFDALTMQWDSMQVPRRNDCEVCAKRV